MDLGPSIFDLAGRSQERLWGNRSAFSAAWTLAGRGNAPSRCRYRSITAAMCGAAARICAHWAAAARHGYRPAGSRRAGGQRAHRATSCAASISETAAVSASIGAAARRYSPASQSLARLR